MKKGSAEEPRAHRGKMHKLPIMTRSTLWLVIFSSMTVLMGIVAALLVPLAMSRGIPPAAETNAIMSSIGQAVDARRQITVARFRRRIT
ncbi:MAG: hypothetical protein ACLQVA_02635 [Candidatus Brocadiia bacterium]